MLKSYSRAIIVYGVFNSNGPLLGLSRTLVSSLLTNQGTTNNRSKAGP